MKDQEKIYSDDAGPLTIILGIRNNHLIIDFGKPVRWIGLHKQDAIDLAQNIIQKAERLRDSK